MTKALAEATRKLDAATAEAEAIEEYERNWSAGARRARLETLRQDQLDAAEAEATEKRRLAHEAIHLATELEPLYAEAQAAMESFVLAAEAVIDARAPYEDAWRRARAAGVAVAPLVPRSDARAASERGDLLRLVQRLKTVNARSW